MRDVQIIQPTNKKFQTEFCTVATWNDGKITEDGVFYYLKADVTKIDAQCLQKPEKLVVALAAVIFDAIFF